MERDIKRRENENKLSYFKRITDNRKEYDLDYSEWCNLITNKEYSSDNARKAYYIVKPLLDNLDEEVINNIKDNDVLKDIEAKTRELRVLRKQVLAEKIELNRLDTKEGRFKNFYENIKDGIERLPLPKFENIAQEENNVEYLVAFADLHYGADFVSENNTYSREECNIRMENLASKVKNKCVNLGINKLHILSLGDMIQGMLRITDVKLNDVSTVECVVEVSRLVAMFLNSISEVANINYYHIMRANHTQPRYLGTKANAMPNEDMEIIIGNYIKDLLENNERVKIILSEKDYTTFELEGQNIIAMHGHQIKNVKNAIRDLSQLHRKFYDICIWK